MILLQFDKFEMMNLTLFYFNAQFAAWYRGPHLLFVFVYFKTRLIENLSYFSYMQTASAKMEDLSQPWLGKNNPVNKVF